jgi:hypothetical protein
LLALAVLTSCNDDTAQFVFDARIVDGGGGNPAAGTDATTLRIGIQEGELPVRELEYPIEDGQFAASLEFQSFSSITRLRVAIEGPTTELVTAPPAFVPSASFGFLQVVTAPPSSCELVTFNAMQAPRSEFGMVLSGTFALLAGGTSADAEQVEFLDALEWESRLFDEEIALAALGPTRAVTIGEGQILVIPTNADNFIFDMLNSADRVTIPALHTGAGPRSALVSIPGVGAMVIGGEDAGVARAGVSLVRPRGEVESLMLDTPRAGAVATALGEDVLVVGGDADGSAELLLSGNRVGEPVAGVMDGVRTGGVLVGDGESRALLLGGLDADSAVRQDTLRFDQCPPTCASQNGPTWTTARVRTAVPEGARLLVGGSDAAGDASSLIEEVIFDDPDVRIESVAELNTARASAGAMVYESGAFVVGGGSDSNGIRDDFEFCVPAALTPL